MEKQLHGTSKLKSNRGMVEDLERYYITKFASPEMTTIEKDSQYFFLFI